MDLYNVDKKKIDANLQRMQRLINKENNVIVKVNWFEEQNSTNQIQCYQDFEIEFEYYLRNYNLDSEACDLGFDNIPYFRVDFGRVAYLMSIAYDCEPIMINGLINTKPRILDDVEEIWAIRKKENIAECGFYPEISRRMLEIERRLGGVYFVPGDVQSPIDVAMEIVKSDTFMLAMYDNKEPLHYLLDIITESIHEICIYQGRLVRNWIGYGHDYPLPQGIHLSDDNAAFLSPATYEEFALPYNSRLGRYFKGVTLHCCMGQRQNIRLMASTDHFLGFDPQIVYNPEDEILDAVSKKGFWRIWNLPEGYDPLAVCKRLIDNTDGRCGLLLDLSAPSRDEALRLACAVKDYTARYGRE